MMKFCYTFLIVITGILSFTGFAKAKDSIELTICTNVNKRIPGEITPVSRLKGKALYIVYGHIKMVSDSSDIEHEKYYLEWAYDDGSKEIVLDNYNKNPRWLIYERRTGHVDDYYWVNKVIFGNNTGK